MSSSVCSIVRITAGKLLIASTAVATPEPLVSSSTSGWASTSVGFTAWVASSFSARPRRSWRVSKHRLE
jgi:hypothetical protein